MSHDFEIAKKQLFDFFQKRYFLLCISDFMKLFRRIISYINSILLRTQHPPSPRRCGKKVNPTKKLLLIVVVILV